MSLELKTRVVREIPGMIITWSGGAVPWQAEGTYFGRPFYARFRGDSASLATYEDENRKTPIKSAIIDDYFGDPLAGELNDSEAIHMLTTLVSKLADVSEENPTSEMRVRAYIEQFRKQREADDAGVS